MELEEVCIGMTDLVYLLTVIIKIILRIVGDVDVFR